MPITAHEILAARRVTRRQRAAVRATAWRWSRTLSSTSSSRPSPAPSSARCSRLRAAGARIEEIALPELADLAPIKATGGFSAAESYAWHRLLLERSGAGYDPRVAQRILKGAAMKAHEYIDLHARAPRLDRPHGARARTPSTPCCRPRCRSPRRPSPSVAPGAERDEEFFRVNALLLRNPAWSTCSTAAPSRIPCHAPGELPVGLMLWHAALHDDAVLAIALQAERALQAR